MDNGRLGEGEPDRVSTQSIQTGSRKSFSLPGRGSFRPLLPSTGKQRRLKGGPAIPGWTRGSLRAWFGQYSRRPDTGPSVGAAGAGTHPPTSIADNAAVSEKPPYLPISGRRVGPSAPRARDAPAHLGGPA